MNKAPLCKLHGKIFRWGNRQWKISNYSWGDGLYICDEVGGGNYRYFSPDEILLALLKEE